MLREQIHHYIYLFALLIIICSIPVSNFGMSIGGLLLSLNWVVSWDWKAKWLRLKATPLAFILASFFFIFLIGLIQTNNYGGAIDNILSKLPLLYSPLILASSTPLKGKEIRFLLFGFIVSTFVSTIISITYLLTHTIQDIREISLFISHIRFSFCLLMAIIFSIQLGLKVKTYALPIKILFFSFALWFILYLFISQTFTGIILLFSIALIYFIFLILSKEQRKKKALLLGTLFIGISLFIGYIVKITWDYYHVSLPQHLPEQTISGNPYTHNVNSIVENGSYTEIFLCEKELQEEWGKISSLPYDSVKPSLIRYLNAKGLRKDREGIKALNTKDISNIEHRIANIAYTEPFGIKKTLYPTFFSISLHQKTKSIENSSLLQRLALWKASFQIIKKHFWTGVGIGDHKTELNRQIALQNFSLRNDMGAHNQFLTFWLMGGVLLFIPFLIILFIPFLMHKNAKTLVYIFFFVIIFCSFFTEDTLETQAGMTFFAFFNSFLLFCYKESNIFTDSLVLSIFDNKKGK